MWAPHRAYCLAHFGPRYPTPWIQRATRDADNDLRQVAGFLEACEQRQATRDAAGEPFKLADELPTLCSDPDRSANKFKSLEGLANGATPPEMWMREVGDADELLVYTNLETLVAGHQPDDELDKLAELADALSLSDVMGQFAYRTVGAREDALARGVSVHAAMIPRRKLTLKAYPRPKPDALAFEVPRTLTGGLRLSL